MKLTCEEFILGGSIKDLHLQKLMIEKCIYCLYIVSDATEERRLWHVLPYTAHDYLWALFFWLLLLLQLWILSFEFPVLPHRTLPSLLLFLTDFWIDSWQKLTWKSTFYFSCLIWHFHLWTHIGLYIWIPLTFDLLVLIPFLTQNLHVCGKLNLKAIKVFFQASKGHLSLTFEIWCKEIVDGNLILGLEKAMGI